MTARHKICVLLCRAEKTEKMVETASTVKTALTALTAETERMVLTAEDVPAAAAVETPAPAVCGGKVILFSRVTCPNCRVAESLLAKAGIAYEKLIADENVELCKQYGVKGAPTLIITDGEAFESHYSVPEIKKYIATL